jgi:uncharacterized PurR-regulated membrane protein YhhQ (DUF165 family)
MLLTVDGLFHAVAWNQLRPFRPIWILSMNSIKIMWGEALVLTIVGQYIVKLVVAGIDTVPFYIVTEFYND